MFEKKVSWTKQHSAPTAGISFSPSNDKVSFFIASLNFIVYSKAVSSRCKLLLTRSLGFNNFVFCFLSSINRSLLVLALIKKCTFMILDLEDHHLTFLMKHLSLHWPLEMMVGCWLLELAMAVWHSMMFVENRNLLLFFTLMVVLR